MVALWSMLGKTTITGGHTLSKSNMRLSCHLRLSLYLASHRGPFLVPCCLSYVYICVYKLSQVVRAHDPILHHYADNCQIYLTMSVSDAPASVSRCIDDMAAWMSASQT